MAQQPTAFDWASIMSVPTPAACAGQPKGQSKSHTASGHPQRQAHAQYHPAIGHNHHHAGKPHTPSHGRQQQTATTVVPPPAFLLATQAEKNRVAPLHVVPQPGVPGVTAFAPMYAAYPMPGVIMPGYITAPLQPTMQLCPQGVIGNPPQPQVVAFQQQQQAAQFLGADGITSQQGADAHHRPMQAGQEQAKSSESKSDLVETPRGTVQSSSEPASGDSRRSTEQRSDMRQDRTSQGQPRSADSQSAHRGGKNNNNHSNTKPFNSKGGPQQGKGPGNNSKKGGPPPQKMVLFRGMLMPASIISKLPRDDSPEALEAWLEERKRRYPTRQRVEEAMKVQQTAMEVSNQSDSTHESSSVSPTETESTHVGETEGTKRVKLDTSTHSDDKSIQTTTSRASIRFRTLDGDASGDDGNDASASEVEELSSRQAPESVNTASNQKPMRQQPNRSKPHGPKVCNTFLETGECEASKQGKCNFNHDEDARAAILEARLRRLEKEALRRAQRQSQIDESAGYDISHPALVTMHGHVGHATAVARLNASTKGDASKKLFTPPPSVSIIRKVVAAELLQDHARILAAFKYLIANNFLQ